MHNGKPNTIPQTINAGSFADVFKSQSPVISSPKIDKFELRDMISKKCFAFLTVHSPNDGNVLIADMFTELIIDTRWDWKPEDVDYFFKFVFYRQDLEQCRIFGNKITAMKLSELVSVYEDYRCEFKENDLKERTSKLNEPMTEISKRDVNAICDEILTRLKPAQVEFVKREKTDEEIQVDLWLVEFDNLYKKCGFVSGGIRFVNVDGVNHDIDSFLLLKLDAND